MKWQPIDTSPDLIKRLISLSHGLANEDEDLMLDAIETIQSQAAEIERLREMK